MLQKYSTMSFTDMNIRFEGKRALVTGAGKGIGRGIALALAASGAKTYALSRTKADLDSLQKECPAIHVVQCDATDWDATAKTVESLGRIDLLVNNAGTAEYQEFVDVTPDSYDRIMDINLKAIINIGQVVVKGMIERKDGGAVVNVSSHASQAAGPGYTVYCASKAGMDATTRVMAVELGKHNIRVNSVNPTVVLTDLGKKHWSDPEKAGPLLSKIPLGRFAEVKDIVHPVLYLLSDKADMITGVSLPIDGGFLAS